jgi:hypothetical protein
MGSAEAEPTISSVQGVSVHGFVTFHKVATCFRAVDEGPADGTAFAIDSGISFLKTLLLAGDAGHASVHLWFVDV